MPSCIATAPLYRRKRIPLIHGTNNLDDIDEDEVLTVAMRTMAIGDVRPQEQQEQDQPSSSTLVHPQLKMRNKYLKI
jgi:hypothetical protein